MKRIKVKEFMVSLEEYATVDQDATLYQAIISLEEAQEKFDRDRYRHLAILVLNKNKQVVGKVSQGDVLRALEPKYGQMMDFERLTRSGFSPNFLKSMLKDHQLWEAPMEDICRLAAKTKVKDIMYTPRTDEYVTDDTSLAEAIHRIVMGDHWSLLVTSGDKIVGILRRTDVFKEICNMVKKCNI